MTCKFSGRGSTLTAVHAKVTVMEGRTFLGSVTARKEWDEQPGPGWAPAEGREGIGGKTR